MMIAPKLAKLLISKTHYIHICHHIEGTIILILMFWGGAESNRKGGKMV